MPVVGLDHVQLAMPAGREDEARAFYSGLLGIREVAKPPELAKRGGAWFEDAGIKLHVGVDPDFRPAKKAHPGILVVGLGELSARLRAAGYSVTADASGTDHPHAYVDDPFGNRLELIEQA